MTEMYDPQGSEDFALPAPDRIRTVDIASATVFTDPKGAGPASDTTPGWLYQHDAKAPLRAEDDGTWLVWANPSLPKDQREVWHYTDTAGLLGILEGQTIRATSVASLNDSSEYRHGRELLGSLMNRLSRSRLVHPLQKEFIREVVAAADQLDPSELCVACASLASDSLAQWRAYGGNQSHAVILDASSSLATDTGNKQPVTLATPPLSWSRVLYDVSEQTELLTKALGFLACITPPPTQPIHTLPHWASWVDWLREVLLHCKHPSFSEEQEVRCIVRPTPAEVRFRAGTYGVTAYTSLTGSTDPLARSSPGLNTLPITAVAVGPFPHRASSSVGLRRYMDSIGCETIAVRSTAATALR